MSKAVSKSTSTGINWRQAWDSPKEFGKSLTIGLATIAGILLVVLPRISEVLPKILGDELLYSQNARLLSPEEWFLPNFLFNWVFSSTNVCGYGFYTCGKVINVFLLLCLGFIIYASTRLIAKPSLSLIMATLTCVGPIAVYASFFTPDMMFYLSMAIVIFIAMQLNLDSKWWMWFILGATLAVASLVKPHALFAIPALIAYCLFLALGTNQKKIAAAFINIVILVSSTILLKFAFGFAFAGPNGLTLFGSYGNALDSASKAITQTSTPGVQLGGTSTNPISTPAPGAAQPAVASTDFATMAVWELILHFGFLIIAFSLPLFIAGRRIGQSMAIRNTNPVETKLSFLAISILLMGVISTAIYTAVAPSWGEILDYRLMVRYYEYVLPFLVITALVQLDESNKRHVRRIVFSFFAIIVAVLASTKLVTVVPPLYTDSTLFSGMYFSNISIWVFAIISAGLLLFYLINQKKAVRYWLFGWLPIVTVIVAISTQIAMTGPSSIKGLYTNAAQTTHQLLTQEQRDALIVVGNYKNNVQAAQLWIDSKSVQGLWIDRGQNLDIDSLAPEAKYVLIIGEMNVSGSFEVVKQDESFAIIKRP
jgi:phosphoglycerol transferase